MRTAPHWSSVLRAKVLHLLQGAVCGHLDLHAHVCGQKGEQETWIMVKAPRAPARKLKQPYPLCALLPLERGDAARFTFRDSLPRHSSCPLPPGFHTRSEKQKVHTGSDSTLDYKCSTCKVYLCGVAVAKWGSINSARSLGYIPCVYPK